MADVTLKICAPRPKLPTRVKTFDNFFAKTRKYWQKRQGQLKQETHLRDMTPAMGRISALMGLSFPSGDGNILMNLQNLPPENIFPKKQCVKIKVPLGLNLLADTLKALKKKNYLDMRRMSPNPPPCTGTQCPAMIVSDAQKPGTIYFVQTADKTGRARYHKDLARLLAKALGVDRAQVNKYLKNGRITIDELVRVFLANKKHASLKTKMSAQDLKDLLLSYLPRRQRAGVYLPRINRGSFRQMALRALITLQDVGELGSLIPKAGQGQVVLSHDVADSDFHAFNGDGSDMQHMAVLPYGQQQVATLMKKLPTNFWDHWLEARQGSGLRRLLGRIKYTVTTQETRRGKIQLIHFQLKSGPKMKAHTRTIRLVPIENGKKTLLVWDEHLDSKGSDMTLPYTLRQFPKSGKPRINTQRFLDFVTRMFFKGRNPALPKIHARNHFAVAMNRLMCVARKQNLSTCPITIDSRDTIRKKTVRYTDYLSLAKNTTTQQWVLKIALTADDLKVINHFKDFKINPVLFTKWLKDREIPVDELRKAMKLDRYFDKAPFRAIAMAFLTPSKDIAHMYKSSTERYLLVIRHLQKRMKAMQGPKHPADFLIFKDDRFHPNISTASEEQQDTVDTMTTYYVPKMLNWRGAPQELKIEPLIKTIANAAIYGRVSPDFDLKLNHVSKNPQLRPPAKVDPHRTYFRAHINTPSLDYLISSPHDPVSKKLYQKLAGAYLSEWKLESSANWNDFLDNTGWWLVIPVKNKGFMVLRAGILNTKYPVDTEETFAKTARESVIRFLAPLVTATLDEQLGRVWKKGMKLAIKHGGGIMVTE